MSGHSHWSTIRRKKEANDASRGAVFTKLAREIAIAVREGGGGDSEFNVRLRMLIDKARSMGMPRDNIDRAIKRATGDDKEGFVIEEITYEGYGPSGVAMIIDVVTDNRNRTVAAVRHALTRAGGSMSTPGSVAWQFDRRGSITVPPTVKFDTLFEAAVEAGAEDVIDGGDEDDHEVRTASGDLHAVVLALQEKKIPVSEAKLIMVPQSEIPVDQRDGVQVLKLISSLEELDDVTQVFSNLEMSEEVVAAFAESVE